MTRGLEREEVDEVQAGDIVWINLAADITIGDTLSATDLENPALPPLEIEEPTVSMFFMINSGPFSGNDGRAVTLRQIRERLDREQRVNVALRVEDMGRAEVIAPRLVYLVTISGTPQQPGLMMVLEPGGSCIGVAYRLPDENHHEQMLRLLRRETASREGLAAVRAHDFAGADAWTADAVVGSLKSCHSIHCSRSTSAKQSTARMAQIPLNT